MERELKLQGPPYKLLFWQLFCYLQALFLRLLRMKG